jgi:hypothetical protein
VAPDNFELAVKKGLNVETFRHVRKEHILALAESLADANPEVAIKIIAQIPEFSKLVRAALDDAEKSYQTAVAALSASQAQAHEIRIRRLDALRSRLDRPDLTHENEVRILAEMREIELEARAEGIRLQEWLTNQRDSDRFERVLMVGAVIGLAYLAARAGTKSGFPRFSLPSGS